MSGVSIGLYVLALVFIMICVGTSVGALSKAKDDRKKAGDMGLTALAFCMLAVVFAGAGKFMSGSNAPKP